MTSVLSLLLQLSGNKYILLGLLCFALSCSSKQYANEQVKLKSDYEKQHSKSDAIKSEKKIVAQTPIVKHTPVDSNDLIYPIIKKNSYKIAFILPLMLETDDQYESQQRGLARSALDFYMGAMIALQKETEKLKIHFDVYFFDCHYKTGTITSEIIPELKKIQPDLIIGPFLFDQLKELSPFCHENKINLISPLVNSDSCLYINPYFFVLHPSEKTHLAYITKLLNSNFQQYNISIIAETAQEKDRYTKMISSIIDTNRFGKIHSYNVNESNWRTPYFIKNMIDGKNVFIILNKNRQIESKYLWFLCE